MCNAWFSQWILGTLVWNAASTAPFFLRIKTRVLWFRRFVSTCFNKKRGETPFPPTNVSPTTATDFPGKTKKNPEKIFSIVWMPKVLDHFVDFIHFKPQQCHCWVWGLCGLIPPCAAVLAGFFERQKQNGCYKWWKTIPSGLSLEHECKKRMWLLFSRHTGIWSAISKMAETVVFLLERRDALDPFSMIWGKTNMCQGRNFRQCGRSSHLELENPSGGYLNPLLSGYIGFMTIPYHSERTNGSLDPNKKSIEE